MLATDAPYSQYFDTDGSPLDAGSIYFGTANLNPVTSPVTVYWDAAGTQPAAQPIRTLNGYTVRSGTPAIVYAAADYSILVRNGSGQMVYYAASSSAYGNRQAILADLANTSDPAKGAGMVGYAAGTAYAAGTIGAAVQQLIADLADTASAAKGAGLIGFNHALVYAAGTAGNEMRGSYALRSARTAPHANFNWFTADFTVLGCPGYGRATILQDIADVFLTKYTATMSGVTKYVAPASKGGSDANTGDSWASPYLTLNKGVRSVLMGTLFVWPGTYAPDSFRYTDTGGGQPKRIIAPFGGVVIATPGDTLSAAVFAANATYPQVYETTLVAAPAAATPIRILLSTTLDKYGEPTPVPKQSSIASVDGAILGWWYDTATQKLYIRNGVENVNTVTKANLSAVYAAGGDNSILLLSTTSYWENITFHAYAYILKQAGQAAPEGWFKRCTFKYAESNSRNVQGGGCYTQDCRFYRSTADHANYNTASSTTAYALEVRDLTQFAGDVDTFGKAATQPNNPISTGQNKNGSSNHDGYVVRINCYDDGAFGPNYADTDGSYTWNLGVQANYNYATGTTHAGFITQGAAARAWYDGCACLGGNSGFNSDTSAVLNIFNSLGSQVISAGGTFVEYAPT